MRKIEVYIQPYNLDTVAEALAVEGVARDERHRGQGLRRAEGIHARRGHIKPGEYGSTPR